jgi:photosystem II stability/assembly factor-like uncharacterized protein
MKLALRGLLVLVVAGMATQMGSAASTRMRLVNSPASFILWNAHDGLLGVERCDPRAGSCVSGAVERTSDGGRTYHVVLRTRRPVGVLRTSGRYGAIATTVDGPSWRTLDRGRTWHRVASGSLSSYWLTSRIGVSFRSYVVRNQEHLALRGTHDGGRTWQRRRDPCEKAIAFNAIADLVTPRLWWIACLGQPAAGSEDKAIYRTRNGGRTWEAGAATLPIGRDSHPHGGIQEYGYPDGLAFAPDGFGLLTESRGTLYVTRDGGVHWRARPGVARPEVDFAGGAAAFRGGVGYVLLTFQFRGRLLRTSDYGRTWQVVRRWRG